MTIKEILDIACSSTFFQLIFVILICSIKIPKVEINVWGMIGRVLNKNLDDKVDKIEKLLTQHIEEEEVYKVTSARKRILRFNDDLLQGIEHTEEYFDDVLSDIDYYERYCINHPDYANNKAVLSIANIKEYYGKIHKIKVD